MRVSQSTSVPVCITAACAILFFVSAPASAQTEENYRGKMTFGMYAAGGTWMAMWLGVCSLAGIALSVLAPLFVVKKFNLLPARASR